MKTKMIVGWREWVGLPELGIGRIKAKVDTGARSCTLHATFIHAFSRDDDRYVRFTVHPRQRESRPAVSCEALIVDDRKIKSSSGHIQHRYVIRTVLALGGKSWPVEVTLCNREGMGFRMLVGRMALRKFCVVDPGRSFVTSPSRK